jgi:hypothetical protein
MIHSSIIIVYTYDIVLVFSGKLAMATGHAMLINLQCK